MKVYKVATVSPSAGNLRWAPTNANQQTRVSTKPSPEPEVSDPPTSDSAPESRNIPNEGISYFKRLV